jgi:hypothetical protein
MAIKPQSQEQSTPVPFFTDSRSLSEKLAAEDREWRPHQQEHKCPAEIFGLVLELGEYFSSYRDASGENKTHTTARVLSADNTVWSVVAFHGFLQSEFDRKKPRVGDFVAIAYKGTRPAKKAGESDANVYRLEVERNPDSVPVETNDRGNEALVGSDPAPPIPAVEETVEIDNPMPGRRDDDDDIPF